MNPRLRLLLLVSVGILVLNVGWRIWAGWGRVTINADDKPVSEVLRSLEKQAGIRIRTNLPADKTVTMHVRKVSLMHAFEVLSANTSAGWAVTYITAPDKAGIETALGKFASSQEGSDLEGWKRF